MTPQDSSNPPDRQAFIDSIVRGIGSLPLEEQTEAILDVIATAMEGLPVEVIVEIREEILVQFADQLTLPIVRDTLELIEGHLAIRALREEAP